MSRTFDVTLPLPLISGQPIRIREKNITDLTDILEGFHRMASYSTLPIPHVLLLSVASGERCRPIAKNL